MGTKASYVKHTQVRIAIMSHLSDAQYLVENGLSNLASNHINFAKYLLLTFSDNINREVPDDKLTELWNKVIIDK